MAAIAPRYPDMRDKELEYLRQVDRLASASQMIEGMSFDPSQLGLEDILRRDDALGNLSRIPMS